MNYLVDSTDIIDVLRKKKAALEFIKRATLLGDVLLTSAMNVAEVYGGMRPGEEAETASILTSFTCLSVTPEIARRAGELKAEWSRKGRTLGIADMIVAATALEYGLTLVTNNLKDFPVEGLLLLAR